MSEVVAHGYLGITAPDLGAWRSYATEVLGMQVSPASEESRLLLRIDERSWRFAVEVGPGGFAYSGWEVASPAALAALAERLDGAGIAYKEEPALARERRVAALMTCEDPAGNRLEFFHGALVDKAPFVSPRGVRFVTGLRSPGDLGWGHAAMTFDDLDAAKHFYMGVLGFKLSDTIDSSARGGPAAPLVFLHVNPRAHSFVLASREGPSTLAHLMVEADDLDCVGRALDSVLAGAAPLSMTLGKHVNDHAISFYSTSPSGFEVEFGYGSLLIDDETWTTPSYDQRSYWGHERIGARRA